MAELAYKDVVGKNKAHKITEREYARMDRDCTYPWELKRYEQKGPSDEIEALVVLTQVYKGGAFYTGNVAKYPFGFIVNQDCFAIHYIFGNTGKTMFLSDMTEAIDRTLKLIELAKA